VPHPDTMGQRRTSIPFFHNPNPDAMVECIPTCHSESNPPKYAPLLAKTHMEMKVSKALGTEEKMSN
jgi:isopenicillin N synthase-like dioxygenase